MQSDECREIALQPARVWACAVAAGILTSRHVRSGNRPGAQPPADDVSGTHRVRGAGAGPGAGGRGAGEVAGLMLSDSPQGLN